MDPALWELLKTSDHLDGEEVEAIVRLDQPQAGVAGLRIISRFGPIATCRLKRDRILQVREEENVLSLKAKRVFAPEPEAADTDEALPLVVTQGDVRRPPGLALTGTGVVIGIVDWGCDFGHPNFRRVDGSTRLLALWDQRGSLPPGAPNRYGYGTIHTRAQIDRALQSDNPYRALGYHPADADPGGTGAHGTHVMDIAAGNGRGGGPVGVAPEADLIFVHLANKGTSGLANLGDSVRILEAVDFVARVAGSRPWVINLSIGRHGGPHDGKTLIELAFDYLLSAAPNRFICQSTGNYFDRSTHASGCLHEGEERTLNMLVDEADYTPNELEIWYSGKDEFAIRAESPTGTLSQWVALGEDVEILENGQVIGRLYNRAFDPNNADHQIDGFLYSTAPPGLWRVTIRAVRVVDGSFHAWLERDDACLECQTRFSGADVDQFYTTGTLANSQLPLVVGAYDAHSPTREIAPYSSAGPTRDKRSKPDLVAPGDQVLAARSALRGWRINPGLLVRKSGTSMATPQVTGAVALCLQAAPRPLWSHEIRAVILGQAEPVTADRQTTLRYGRGYLDINRAVTAVSGLSSFAIAPSIYRRAGADGRSRYSMEERMKPYLDSDYFDLLDQVISEPSSRATSEKNLLAQILRENGVTFETSEIDPDKLYRELVFGLSGGRAKSIASHFIVVARPGEVPQSPPREGDILLRVTLGHPGLGHVAVINDSTLWPDEDLASAPFGAERQQPGYYAVVSEAGACPHPRSQPFARRILDGLKRMLPSQLLMRLSPPDDKPSSIGSQPLPGEWTEESELFLPGETMFEEALGEEMADAFLANEGCSCGKQTTAGEECLCGKQITADEESAWDDIPAWQPEPVESEEEFDESEHHFPDVEKMEPAGVGTSDEFYEDTSFEDIAGAAYDAQLAIQKMGAGTALTKLTLLVPRWEKAERASISNARLKVFEVDLGESGRSDAATLKNDQIAEFTLDLGQNPEFAKNPNKAGIPRVSVSNAKWANPTLEKSYKATRRPDLILKLGRNDFPLWFPRKDILEEGNALEIGFTLEDGEGNKIERLSLAGSQVVSIPILNYLEKMLKIPGRFDDTKRDPALEVDGTKFGEFLKGKNRREFIARWLEEHPALKEAANEPDADLKTSDIVKAWFVIHDVGNHSSLTDKRFKANQPKSKSGAVHGFLNRAGYYAATHDFTKNKSGTVYEFMSKNGLKYVNGHTINIETVPDIEPNVPDKADGSRGEPSNADQYASIGYKVYGKKVTYYKWTKAAFDVLADLYIFASARAGHLLTITVHKEMDRNLGRSVIWREYSAKELRAWDEKYNLAERVKKIEEAKQRGDKEEAGRLRKENKHYLTALYYPEDYHGDPAGFNIQALYDLITKKLNALAGKQLQIGVRYGIHPRRICKENGENFANSSSHLHEFPCQSDPDLKKDKDLKDPGWWKVNQAESDVTEEYLNELDTNFGEERELLASESAPSQGVFAREGLKTARFIEQKHIPLILSALEQSPVLGPLLSAKLKTITISKNFVFHGHDDTFNYKYTKLHNIIIPPGPTAAKELLNIRGFYHRETDTIHLRPRSSLGLALALLIQKLLFPGFRVFGASMIDGLGHYFANLVLAEQGLDPLSFEKHEVPLRCATDLIGLAGIKMVAKAYFENHLDLMNFLTNNLSIGHVEPREIMGDALCKTPLVRTARFASHQLSNMIAVGTIGPDSVRLWMRSGVPGTHELQIQGGAGGARNVTLTIPDGPGDNTAVIDYPGTTGHPPLNPLTKYRYRIVRTTDRESLGEGSFETSPARDGDTPEKVVIGLLSCHEPFFTDRGTIYPEADRMLRVLPRILRDKDVKFLLPCGDQMYADSPDVFSLFENRYLLRMIAPDKQNILQCNASEVRRLYDLRYRMCWSMPAIRKMYANYPSYPILDDHEIMNSWGNDPKHSGAEYKNIRQGALEAYYDYQASRILPQHPLRTGKRGSFHYDFSYGNIGVFVMDIRSQRYNLSPHGRQIFSPAQFNDLRLFLQKNGHKKVLIIVSSVPVVFVPGALADASHALHYKEGTFQDHWSHPSNRAARDALLSLLHAHQRAHPKQRIALACGDVHIGNAYSIQWEGGGGYKPTLYQFTSSALTARESRLDYLKIRAGQRMASWGSVDCPSTPYGGPCSARIDHLPGGKNPFTGPNIGLIEVLRYGDISTLKFKLIGYHATEDRPHTYFESTWLE